MGWSISIVRKNEDRVANPPSYANLVKAIAAFRQALTDVVTYGHVTVPLVYTQVVHLAVTSTLVFPLWHDNGYRFTKRKAQGFLGCPSMIPKSSTSTSHSSSPLSSSSMWAGSRWPPPSTTRSEMTMTTLL